MRTDETLEDVAHLLSLLPGVTIAWTQAWPEMFRVGMHIEEPSSLGLLVHLNRHWNLAFGVEAEWSCSGPHDDPACVRYDLRISREERTRMSKIKSVATMLIDELESRALIGQDEAASMRGTWRERQ